MRELFIYYRVRGEAAPAALDAVQAMQARLRAAHPGLVARLLRRAHDNDGEPTWMETYACEPAGVSRAIEAEIALAATALASFLAGERHTEVFVPCAW